MMIYTKYERSLLQITISIRNRNVYQREHVSAQVNGNLNFAQWCKSVNALGWQLLNDCGFCH